MSFVTETIDTNEEKENLELEIKKLWDIRSLQVTDFFLNKNFSFQSVYFPW